MMDKFNKLIEHIDVSKIVYRGENIWPIFRIKIAGNLITQTFQLKNAIPRKRTYKLAIAKIFTADILKLIWYRKKYDCIYFTNPDDYRTVDGKCINRLIDEFRLHYPSDTILEVQSTFSLKKSDIFPNVNYISNTFIIIFKLIISKLIYINSVGSISKELEKYGIFIDAKKVVKEYIADVFLYKLLYKITKPKMIISTCYTSMPAIKVANDLNIDTLEFQHGKISEHFAYIVSECVNSKFYPKYMAVFGNNDKELLSHSGYIVNKENIFVVGNMLVSYFSHKDNQAIQSFKNKYSKIISVTLQWTVLDEVVEYIKKEAKLTSNYCFILIPRTSEELKNHFFCSENIKIFHNLTCYEIVANSDYHFTVYSTCAYEVPSLGVKNIFYNIRNLSIENYANYVKSNTFNLLLEPSEHIQETISKDSYESKKDIMQKNSDYIRVNYQGNIKKMIQNIRIKG